MNLFVKPLAVLPALLLLSAIAALLLAAEPQPASRSLDNQVERWVEQLSEEEGFASWKGASWRKSPLGPGQHGWVVIVQGKNGEEAGYLVISATPDPQKYVLIEYGTGGLPLFSNTALERALESGALREEGIRFTNEAKAERLFIGGALALWKVSENGQTRYAEAKTGIWLPVVDQDVNEAIAQDRAHPVVFPKQENIFQPVHILMEPTDPYMSLAWLEVPEANVQDWESFNRWMDQSEAKIYALRAFGGKALTPLGVAGVHRWAASGETGYSGYVAVEQEGLRYLPLERLLQNGTFH